MALPESSTGTLFAVRSARALTSAVKTIWLASLTTTRPSLQSSLLDLIGTVEEQHGSTGLGDQRLAALQTLDPLIDAASARPGVAWSALTATLLAVRPTVVPAEAVATYLSVQDPITYRIAISSTVQTMPRPEGLNRLVAETQRTLEPASKSAAIYVQFERRTKCAAPAVSFFAQPPPSLALPLQQAPSHPWVWPPSCPQVSSCHSWCPRNQWPASDASGMHLMSNSLQARSPTIWAPLSPSPRAPYWRTPTMWQCRPRPSRCYSRDRPPAHTETPRTNTA